MRVLVALTAVTTAVAVSGCSAALPKEQPPAYAAPNKLVSCHVPLPQDWKEELSRNETRAGQNETVSILAANDNADTTLVRTKRAKTTELVLRDRGHRQQVMTVQDEEQIFGVEFDGRWVTFSTTPNPANQTVTSYAWDSRDDGAPVRINGYPTALRDGKALWSSEDKKIHLYDLAKKKDKVLGDGERPVFFGDAVIWTHQGLLRAKKQDGTDTALPDQLKDVTAVEDVASDGRTIAVATGADVLLGWRPEWQATRKLAEIQTVPMTEGIMSIRVTGDWVSWRSESSYVTDVRTGTSVHSGEGDFWLEVHGGGLVRTGRPLTAIAPLHGLTPLAAC